MGIRVDSKTSQGLLKARLKKNLTQLELSNLAKVSLRTIQDLENNRKDSFSESTLICLCRSLDLDYNKLSKSEEIKNWQKLPKQSILIIIFIIFLNGLFLFYPKEFSRNKNLRFDWIKYLKAKELIVEPYTIKWRESNEQVINYINLKQLAKVNETLNCEIKWSYHYEKGSTPEIFLSAFSEWEPDKEIRIFHGILSGDSSLVRNFKIICPSKVGIHSIRIFYSTSFEPMNSYYGHPAPGQVSSPATAHYREVGIEVVK